MMRLAAPIVEELVKIEHEYYCSIALDASTREFFIIVSEEGGIDIEEVAIFKPETIIKEHFSIQEGLSDVISKRVAIKLGVSNSLLDSMISIFKKLWALVLHLEAELVEINPLILTPSGFIAVDGKIIVDDNAGFRQPCIQEFQKKKLNDLEKLAKDAGFSFVELEGDIGILANGAGLTMALLDVLSELGLRPANFLDVGGGASKERVYKALKIIFKLNPKCILINIFGGLTRCDIVAEAIIKISKEVQDLPPFIIRLTGTNEMEGISLLKKEGISAYK
ncbi:MAG: ATP-grasp domain-containing protein, partial [Promethearchaeota archaeon]